MRDTRKDKEYFASFLKDQYSDIIDQSAKLSETKDPGKKQRILESFVPCYVDLIKAEFSAGSGKDKLTNLMINTCKAAAEYKENSPETLLILMSLAIALDKSNSVKELISKNENLISADRLLSYFAGFLTKGDRKWDNSLRLSPVYAWLDPVLESVDSEEQTERLQNYLNYYWYPNHAEYAWYDSHKRDTNTYCGYWSFESATLVKILDLDEQDFKGLEYSPAL